MRVPDGLTEQRLREIRRRAAEDGVVDAQGIRALGGPLPQATASSGYYGVPLLKPPVWTWEVPAYFFVGGAAGAAAMIGVAGALSGADRDLVREARWLAAIGAVLSAPLLIADLGRPERFLYMLRVFKPQSPMSVGVWILSLFGAASAGAVILPGALGEAAALGSAATGLGMATYTGVLLGATSIPVWARHAPLLPMHFGASATGAAISMLELRGHRDSALNAIGVVAAACETAVAVGLERRSDVDSEPLRRGRTGTLTRISGVLSGPLPLLLRLMGGRSASARRLAAASTIAGSLLTRLAWVAAGRVSADDLRPVLPLTGGDAASPRQAVSERPPAGQAGQEKSQPRGKQ